MAIVSTGTSLTPSGRNFLRRAASREAPVPHRPMTASAQPIDLTNKVEARKMRVLRQGWQQDAGAYVDNLPELSFAYRFLAHASSRMRYFAAIVNPEEPDGPPIPVREHPDAPPGLADDMEAALASLGVGRQALSPIQQSLSYQFGVPGECYLVGQDDPNGGDTWKVRSIDEFMIFDDTYKLREVPLDPQGTLGWVDIDPRTAYAARMWVPWWRFSQMATSPMRSLLDVSEELMLLSRDVRSTARSRLAGGGILKIPDGLRMEAMTEDDDTGLNDSWFGKFAEAMMTPLADEGVASAVVPIAISGEPESLAGLEHLVIDRPYSSLALELRAEAIGRLATGLDVPREVLEGMSDPNHWGAWLVSDDTFRHHIEPQVITQADAMTIAFMRPWLLAKGHNKYWIDRACIWYNPVDLISKPDPMGNAVLLHDRMAISDMALRDAGGFTEEDAPDALEKEIRMIQKLRSFPPNVLEALIHALDPNLVIPPIQQSGQVPGMGPKGAVEPLPTGPAAALPPGPADTTSPAPPPPPSVTATPAATPPSPSVPGLARQVDAAFAEAKAKRQTMYARESRNLAQLDAQLRAKIQVAACSAMVRLLDRAGAKLHTRVASRKFNKDDRLRSQVQGVPNRQVAQNLGQAVVASLGYTDPHALLNPDWSELKGQFLGWTDAAQHAALRSAARLAGYQMTSPAVRKAEQRMATALQPAWQSFVDELNTIAEGLLYNPSPTAPDAPTIDPNTIVPVGAVRRALAIAGGGSGQGKGLTADVGAMDEPVDVTDVSADNPIQVGEDPESAQVSATFEATDVAGQIGTGDAVTDMLNAAPDVEAVSYEWVHGPTLRPFEPHEDLDGESFASFTDDVLANPDDWPENDFFFPGDHDGCSCDFNTVWGPADTGDDTGEEGGDTGEEGEETGEEGEPTTDFSADTGSSYLSQAVSDLLNGDTDSSDLAAAKAELMPEITEARDTAYGQIESMGANVIATPARGDTSGTYDWYRQLSLSEQERLGTNGWMLPDTTGTLAKPDELVAGFQVATGAGSDANVDEAMSYWLDQTRIVDAGNLLENTGRVPNNLERFGNFNWNQLANSNVDVKSLFTNKAEATAYLSEAQKSEAFDLAERELKGTGGPSIWQMSYQDYESEMASLADIIDSAVPITSDPEFGDTYSASVEAAEARYNSLLPEALVSEGQTANYYDLWLQAQQIAQIAGLQG